MMLSYNDMKDYHLSLTYIFFHILQNIQKIKNKKQIYILI